MRYGSVRGLPTEPDRTITQDTPGVPDRSEENDLFGASVAMGDLTGDGNPELVVGAQQEATGPTSGSVQAANEVTVLRGSASGPISTSARWFSSGSGGLAGPAQANDQFGWDVAIQDVNGDGFGDLAISAVGGNVPSGSQYGDGFVTALRGGSNGPSPAGVTRLTGDSTGARFGWSLAQ